MRDMDFAPSHKFYPPVAMKKPTRPPPPPPIESSSSSPSHHRDYIKISDCHSGFPPKPPASFKYRSSTSFSSTLKPMTPHYAHSSYHHKSRSLTNDPHPITYYSSLELPSKPSEPPSVVYNDINISKTEALTRCKAKRDSRLNH